MDDNYGLSSLSYSVSKLHYYGMFISPLTRQIPFPQEELQIIKTSRVFLP